MAKKKQKINLQLLLIILLLLGFGLTALYSASTVESFERFGTTTYFIFHQLIYGALLGLIGMFTLSKIDYHVWQKYLPAMIFISLFSLLLVKISGFGYESGGASRWINIGPVNFQPAELAKLVIIIYLASWADKKRQYLNNFWFGLMPSLTIVGLFSFLILIQPDFGTMTVLVGVAALMLFVAGISLKHFFWLGLAGALSLYGFILFEPYRAKRLTTFLDPGADPQGVGYQINQALLAVGAGGLWGYGYGLSRQKYNYLPEVMGDSIFAVIAEELGFARVIIVLALFTWFAIKGYQIAKNAPDIFGRLLAFGITSWIAIQAIINIGAMINLLPLTGIPLPFFSYGSSSLLVTLASMGILLNISKQSYTYRPR
ncbi:MAG: putative lipid II flippase FtsW [Candidatus Doudnabacteria bacterium CG10_big_fil_rev_8_21_14_0_10_42_18]|uniref:Probable peptidoglycan glycosyltransferase FtsW n=1 Tax=Candidatus Doudnabacteria bacterium CG10_big_fil_rev_8_21_14_0_10_42_18 TaxID=1974552 RepID=A0A2H0VAY5_9BACT|nr:MAG: putative lipid II flippase FtsW [Candidatus Doudnabacteria bacterium CG10_big_fil_rev_8_21_14_0_10_42_18]